MPQRSHKIIRQRQQQQPRWLVCFSFGKGILLFGAPFTISMQELGYPPL